MTSVLQVCDLAANKEVKDLMKRGYLRYRTEFIRAERAKTTNKPGRRIKMKIPIVTMMEIIEDAVKRFNQRQRETESIKRTFISAGQHPWYDCKVDFKLHLDGLSTLPLSTADARQAQTLLRIGTSSLAPVFHCRTWDWRLTGRRRSWKH